LRESFVGGGSEVTRNYSPNSPRLHYP
jgi:hypothetical protein